MIDDLLTPETRAALVEEFRRVDEGLDRLLAMLESRNPTSTAEPPRSDRSEVAK